MTHAEKSEAIKAAIDSLFSDRSVSEEQSCADLRELIEHCEMLIESLDLEE